MKECGVAWRNQIPLHQSTSSMPSRIASPVATSHLCWHCFCKDHLFLSITPHLSLVWDLFIESRQSTPLYCWDYRVCAFSAYDLLSHLPVWNKSLFSYQCNLFDMWCQLDSSCVTNVVPERRVFSILHLCAFFT